MNTSTVVAEADFSLVNLSSLIGKSAVSETISKSVVLLKNNLSDRYILKVLRDFSQKTEFYDLTKTLKTKNYNFDTEWCDRKTLEDIGNRYHDSISKNDEQSDLQSIVIGFIAKAVELRTSDIHIRVESKYTRIYFRIDGKFRLFREEASDHGKKIANTLFNTMCDEQSMPALNYTTPMDAKIKEELVSHLGLSTGRVATRPGSAVTGAERILIVIRLIQRRKQRLTLSELGLTHEQEEIILRAVSRPAGIIFSSGPTGHGKSTLSQCIAELVVEEDPGLNLITIEDPIESPIEGAFQTPLLIGDRTDKALMDKAWGAAIRNVLRLDPDWIYCGEVRDKESATGTIESSQTGHNVVTTSHTSKPIDVISRLKNLGVDYDLITDASLITCLIGLRLAPLLCEHCKLPYIGNEEFVKPIFRKLILQHTNPQGVNILNVKGCKECNHTGIKGRIGVFEVIETSAEFMSLYHQQGKMKAYEYWYLNGGSTLCDNTLRLINSGAIDPVNAHKSICSLDENEKMFTKDVRDKVMSGAGEGYEPI